MTKYRVFIGSWDHGDPDYTNFDSTFDGFERASVVLAVHLASFKRDEIEDVRKQAEEALDRLKGKVMANKPGAFEANINGDDYMIIPVESNGDKVEKRREPKGKWIRPQGQ